MANTKELTRRWLDGIWNQRQLEIVRELIHPQAELQGMGGTGGIATTPSEVIDGVQLTLTAFPDFRLEIHEVVSDGNEAMVRSTATGTHRGDYQGIAGTGRKIELQGFGYGLFKDGLLYRSYNLYDHLTALEQLGVLNSPVSR